MWEKRQGAGAQGKLFYNQTLMAARRTLYPETMLSNSSNCLLSNVEKSLSKYPSRMKFA